MSFWQKRPSGGARRPKPDFSKVVEAERPAEKADQAKAPPALALAKRTAPVGTAAPALAPRKRAAKLSAPKPGAAKPKKAFQLVIGAGSIVSVAALMALMLAWGVGMTLVVLFGDKLSARLIAQNSEMQDAYELRLQAYRDEIARVISEAEQSRVDKDSVVGRVIELTRRQRILETRQNVLNRLADQIGGNPGAQDAGSASQAAPAGGASPPPPPPRPGFPTRAPTPGQTRGDVFDHLAPRFADGQAIARRPLLRLAALGQDGALQFAQLLDTPIIESSPSQSEAELEAQIERLERAMTQIDQQQTRSLNGLARLSDVRIARFRDALTTLGLTPEQLAPESARPLANLPPLVIPLSEQNTPFGLRINQIRGNIGLLQRLQPAVTAMPMDRPTSGFRLASPFGFRIHPISHVSKLHAGLDMAAPLGTPVRAAGSGVVLSAGWGGGYGNLIQIDHGNGVISRYAHLSAIEVAQGQPVALGAVIGLMGSTGASTGSHLHFETRIRSVPQNPACFLIAGDKLRETQNPGFNCDKPPFHQKMPEKDEDEDDDS